MRSVRNAIALATCLVAAPIPAADTATDSLRELSVPEATRLAAGRPDGLRFPALTTLPADVARELARYPGGLALDGLTTLTDDTAEALAAHAGPPAPSPDPLHQLAAAIVAATTLEDVKPTALAILEDGDT